MVIESSWINGLIGGILIGVSATILLAFNGRIAGISGMINGVLEFSSGGSWRILFLGGMLMGGFIYEYLLPLPNTPSGDFNLFLLILGGFLVGFGTRMGNGCTSGHGVCGLGRLSVRSLTAVVSFLASGMITVFIMKHIY
ncbi:MAG: YeeE/YedE family protein [Cyanobacteria bacterium]|uniref:YeeE/YedE family protein n=1 Tax=Geminocystis sp. TaxID=2664100 RepID=UPI001D3780B6|nr:YeeE/YedE family protein [Cyanobacteria bacterium CG_2015-16_32_12]NCO79186.1 YeeE/YedE family protein [Cyanobacteria bacterium CG_2015-22_32_23]NCQ04928.1 YeeE/YedE family protein [Cyanobacteria bacterium CG_2015-09_32_10]NCQ41265.1 YeeE/YedE family protein [Cyanobacteria bacterium CG_2015-04_32_10]NCS84095.1 YeeE/YedE family protein [Cyanobacteria bacterium CG_2015-02_32_10]